MFCLLIIVTVGMAVFGIMLIPLVIFKIAKDTCYNFEPLNVLKTDYDSKPWEIEELTPEEDLETLQLKNDLENAKLKLKDLNELYDLILTEYDNQEPKKPSTLNKLITLNDKIHKQEKIIVKLSETLENEI